MSYKLREIAAESKFSQELGLACLRQARPAQCRQWAITTLAPADKCLYNSCTLTTEPPDMAT